MGRARESESEPRRSAAEVVFSADVFPRAIPQERARETERERERVMAALALHTSDASYMDEFPQAFHIGRTIARRFRPARSYRAVAIAARKRIRSRAIVELIGQFKRHERWSNRYVTRARGGDTNSIPKMAKMARFGFHPGETLARKSSRERRESSCLVDEKNHATFDVVVPLTINSIYSIIRSAGRLKIDTSSAMNSRKDTRGRFGIG